MHRFMTRISAGFRRFMAGRYGTDRLNMTLLVAACVIVLIYGFLPQGALKLLLWAMSYALMIWAIFRTMSRSTYKRYEENRRFCAALDRVKDRQHRYYQCPRCHQSVRVPRGKGKIAITCPRCSERFVRKS